MKKILFTITLMPLFAFAKTSVEFNLLTEHLFSSCELGSRLTNKVGDCGNLINNKIIGINQEFEDSIHHRLIIGENSLGHLMVGMTFSYIESKNGFSYGPILGSYTQSSQPFIEKNIKIFGISGLGIDIIPVIGVESQYKINNFKVYNILTPAVTCLGIGLEF